MLPPVTDVEKPRTAAVSNVLTGTLHGEHGDALGGVSSGHMTSAHGDRRQTAEARIRGQMPACGKRSILAGLRASAWTGTYSITKLGLAIQVKLSSLSGVSLEPWASPTDQPVLVFF